MIGGVCTLDRTALACMAIGAMMYTEGGVDSVPGQMMGGALLRIPTAGAADDLATASMSKSDGAVAVAGIRGAASSAGKSSVIIGENMNRVNSYAANVAGETIDGWLAGKQWTPRLNDQFISAMKTHGRHIQDIGPDFGRRLQNRVDLDSGRPPSPIYGAERQQLLQYRNYQPLYQRIGRYEGGVRGFDN